MPLVALCVATGLVSVRTVVVDNFTESTEEWMTYNEWRQNERQGQLQDRREPHEVVSSVQTTTLLQLETMLQTRQ